MLPVRGYLITAGVIMNRCLVSNHTIIPLLLCLLLLRKFENAFDWNERLLESVLMPGGWRLGLVLGLGLVL